MPATPLTMIPAPPKETAFTDAAGRITLPWLAWLNTLTGALLASTASLSYDALGAAAAAQAAAIAASDPLGAAASAITAAETFSSNAANLTSGLVALARLPVIPNTQISGLGTASTQSSTAFDAAGLAAAAIVTAEAFSANASNLTSGTVSAGLIPTLNQSTTGTAANVTGIVAIANGGTSAPTAAAAVAALGAASLSAANVFAGAATFASSTQTQFNVGLNVFNGPANFYGPGAYVQVVNGAAATATVPQAGEGFFFAGQYWDGAATATDQISFSHTIGAGTNPYIQLNITHVGSTGFVSVVCPGLIVQTQSFFTGACQFTVAPIFTDAAGTRTALGLPASATTDTTNASNIGSGTLPAARLPVPSATTLGGIESLAAVASKWINTISTAGVPSATQPAFTDISGVASAAQLPAPTAATLGGVRSLAAVASKWVNAISTAGIPSATQPAFTDLTGTATAAQTPLAALLAGAAFTGAASFSAGTTLSSAGSAPQTTILAAASSGIGVALKNAAASGHTNWFIGAQQNVNNGLEITPSTALDGGTFTTPVVTVLTTGVSLAGLSTLAAATITGALTLTAGANKKAGSGTLAAGTVAIANTSITANSKIFLQNTNTGALANVGPLVVSAKTAGTGFTVKSTNAADVSTFDYVVIESV